MFHHPHAIFFPPSRIAKSKVMGYDAYNQKFTQVILVLSAARFQQCLLVAFRSSTGSNMCP